MKHQIAGAVDVAIKVRCIGYRIHIGQRKAAAIDSDSAVSAKIKRIPIEGEVIFCFNNGQIGIILRTVLDRRESVALAVSESMFTEIGLCIRQEGIQHGQGIVIHAP